MGSPTPDVNNTTAVFSSVRAKFKVSELRSSETPGNGGLVIALPVCPEFGDDTHENRTFWKYTPGGQLQLSISNQPAYDFYVALGVGGEFYLDMSPAPKSA